MTTTDPYGYGMIEEDISRNSKYLSLKKKGDKITIRLATKPYRNYQVWELQSDGSKRPTIFIGRKEAEEYVKENYPDEKTRPRISSQYGWVVIDRADNQVKVFKGGIQISSGIIGFCMSQVNTIADKSMIGTLPDGRKMVDPTVFDFIITRTEENPYYRIDPVLQVPCYMTEEEQKLVAEANINLSEEMGGAGKSESHNEQYGGAVDLETLPEDETKKEKKPVAPKKNEVDVEADDDKDLPF